MKHILIGLLVIAGNALGQLPDSIKGVLDHEILSEEDKTNIERYLSLTLYKEAQKIIEFSELVSDSQLDETNPEWAALVYFYALNAAANIENIKEARKWIDKAKACRVPQDDPIALLVHAGEIKVLYNEGEIDLARLKIDKLLKTVDHFSESKRIQQSLESAAVQAYYAGEYEEAIRVYIKLIDKSIEMNQFDIAAINWLYVSNIYVQTEQLDKVLETSYKALALLPQVKDTSLLSGGAHQMIGVVHLLRNSLDSALTHFRIAEEIFLATNNMKRLIPVRANLASIYYKTRNYEQAKLAYEQILPAVIQSRSADNISGVLSNLGSIELTLGNYSAAEKYAEMAVDTSSHYNIAQRMVEALRVKSQVDSARGNYNSAYLHLLNYMLLKDSISGERTRNNMMEIEEKYESEKKDLELETARKEQELQNSKIEEQEAEIARKNILTLSLSIGVLLVVAAGGMAYRGYRRKRRDNEIIQTQKELVDEKNQEITDSINYARRLQEATLPTQQAVKSLFTDVSILFKPRDIVSGDFYWADAVESPEGDKLVFFAVADCTGHGVPGAMVSIVGVNALERCLNEFNLREPKDVLDKLRELIVTSFQKSDENIRDGMDIALCSWNEAKSELKFAGANRPLWIAAQGQLEEIKGTKQAVGRSESYSSFEQHTINISEQSYLYLSSDGYADQFGGSTTGGKKFKIKRLKELILELQSSNCSEQANVLNSSIEDWMSSHEQVDDITVMIVELKG